MGADVTKRAIYSSIDGDATIMALLGGRGPYPGRLPMDAPHSETVAAITQDAETSRERGTKELQTLTLSVWAYSDDLIEEVVGELKRLFDVSGIRRIWRPLAVAGGVAWIRWERDFDLPDPDGPLFRKVVRFQVRFAAA